MEAKVDYAKLADYLVTHMRRWFEHKAGYADWHDHKAVVGISGGKDSAVAAAIACEALDKEQVIGVIMPNGEQKDYNDAVKVCEHLDIDYRVVNVGLAYSSIASQVDPDREFRSIATNLPARLRMAALYAYAAKYNARVIGTGNLSEAIVGWTTLWGDSACDYNPLARLYVDEVIEVGRALKDIPEEILTKPPADGMSGKTDEENLGFTYADLKAVMERGDAPREVRLKVMDRAQAACFKRTLLSRIPHPEIERHIRGHIDVEATIDAWGQ